MQLIYHSPFPPISLVDTIRIEYVENQATYSNIPPAEIKLFNKITREFERNTHQSVTLLKIEQEFAQFGPHTPTQEIILERDLKGRIITFRLINSDPDPTHSSRRIYLIAQNPLNYEFGIATITGTEQQPIYKPQKMGGLYASEYTKGTMFARAWAEIYPFQR